MSHRLALLFLAALSLSACHATLEVPVASPSGPQTELPQFARFQVSQPLYDPAKPLAKLPTPTVTVSPPVPFRVSVSSPYTVDVDFVAPLAPAQDYAVTLEPGLVAENGAEVKTARTIRFRTPLNAVHDIAVHDAASEQEQTAFVGADGKLTEALDGIGPNDAISVDFDYAIPASQLDFVKVFVRDGQAVPVTIKQERVPHILVLSPKTTWPRDAALVLSIDRGLKVGDPGAGPLGTEKPFAYDLHSWSSLVVKSGPHADDGGCVSATTVPLEFSNPVSCQLTLSHLSIDVPGTTIHCVGELTARQQRYELSPPPPANRALTLSVTPGIHDAFGEHSLQPSSFPFTACEASVQFAYTKPFEILDPGQNDEEVERLHGAASLQVEGKRLGLKDVWKVLDQEHLTDQVAWTDLPWWMQEGEMYDEWEEDAAANQKKPGELSGNAIPELAGATEVTVPVPGSGWSDVSFGLDQFLGGKKGLVLLRETPLGTNGKPNGRAELRLVNVTDIGLSARMSRETLVVLAASYSSGQPLGGVHVVARSEKGEVLGEGVTGADGLLRLPLLARQDVHGLNDMRLLVVATKGDDEAFLWSRFVVDPNYGNDAPQLVGLVYTDRGIYRPGENGHVHAVVRLGSADGLTSLAGTKAHLTIQAPDDSSFIEKDFTLSPFGSFDEALSIPKTAKVGDYSMRVTAGGSTVYGSFKVGEFRRAEMKVEIQAPPKVAWGSELKAVVQGEYLFGAPTSGLDLEWSLSRRAVDFSSQKFPDADFSAPTRDEWNSEESATLITEGKATLDQNGSFVVRQPMALPNPVSQREQVALAATVEDKNGQSVSRVATVDLYGADVLAGIEGDGFLAPVNKPLTVTAVSVTPADGLAAGTKMRVLTRMVTWRSINRAGSGGGYYWTSERVVSPDQERCQGTTDAMGRFTCTFTPEHGGDLEIIAEATDQSGRVARAGDWRWIYGDASYWGQSSDNPKVGVMFDRTTVDAGQPVKVAITSPYKQGVALVTVEREDVLWQKSFTMGTNATVELPTSLAWAPDVVVVATVVRARLTPKPGQANPEKDKPQYAIGNKTLIVRPKEERLGVKVSLAREQLEPRQNETATIQVKRFDGTPAANAEVNLWAVDEGVLMLTGYTTPDLLSSMFVHRDKRTLGLDTRAYVLGKRTFVEPVIKGQPDGGGGGHGNDNEIRRDFNPLAVWVGSAVTDANGQVTQSFTVPDNLTTYRVMAVVAGNGSHFGQGDAEFRVNKPLMLRQAMSRFVRPGDTLDAGVLVNQLTKAPGTATVSLDTYDSKLFTLTGPTSVQVPIKPGETVPVLFHFTAKDAVGKSALVFSASMGTHLDRVQLDLPVIRRTPRESVSVSGEIASGKFDGSLKLPPQGRAEAVEVNVSGYPLSAMESRLREMVGYPYGCLEQKTSEILPMLAIRDLAQQLDMKSIPVDEIKGWTQYYLSIIPRYRCADDGFDYWPGCHYGSSTILSSYALEGMLTARKYGFTVPQSEIDRTVAFLQKMVRAGSNGRDEYNGDGMQDHDFVGALRVLAEAGHPQPEIEKARFESRAGMPLFSKTDLVRAIAYQYGTAAAQNPMVETLMAEIGQAGKQVGGTLTYDADDPQRYWWAWESPQRNTALVLRTLLQVEPADGRIPLLVKGLVDLDDADPYYVSSDVTQTLLALSDVVRDEKLSANPPSATVTVGGQTLGSGSLGVKTASYDVPAQELGSDIPVEIANTGGVPVFFGAYLSYDYPATARLPAASSGFTLTREYDGQDGKPLPLTETDHGQRLDLTVGDYVKVKVDVRVGSEGRLVLIEDPLAAGLEPVDTSLATTNTAAVRRMGGDQQNDWWDDFDRQLYDDRVEWHFQHVWSHDIVLSYLARATTAGTFYAPGAHAERMYQPAVNGRSTGMVVRIAPKGE